MSDKTLEDNDYNAPDGLWLTIRTASIRIVPHDEGISIYVFPKGKEDEGAITETWVLWGELEEYIS